MEPKLIDERELTPKEDGLLQEHFFNEVEAGMTSNKDNFNERYERWLEKQSWVDIDLIIGFEEEPDCYE